MSSFSLANSLLRRGQSQLQALGRQNAQGLKKAAPDHIRLLLEVAVAQPHHPVPVALEPVLANRVPIRPLTVVECVPNLPLWRRRPPGGTLTRSTGMSRVTGMVQRGRPTSPTAVGRRSIPLMRRHLTTGPDSVHRVDRLCVAFGTRG